MAKFRYLAVPVSESYLMIVHKRTGITKFDDLRGPSAKQLSVGAIPGSTVEHAPILAKEALNLNLKIVSGYKGTADVRLALDSGEVDGFFNTWTSSKITSYDKIKSGEWVLLAQMTETPMKDLIVPNVPTIQKIARSEEQRLLLKYGTSTPNDFGKVYIIPQGVPADRAQALESAFAGVFNDKDLRADATKGKLEIDPLIGSTIQKLVVEFLGMPADVKNKLQTVLKSQSKNRVRLNLFLASLKKKEVLYVEKTQLLAAILFVLLDLNIAPQAAFLQTETIEELYKKAVKEGGVLNCIAPHADQREKIYPVFESASWHQNQPRRCHLGTSFPPEPSRKRAEAKR
jgi:hypothetical protein